MDLAAGGSDEADEATDEGGLAAAGKAHDYEYLSLRDFEVDVSEAYDAAGGFLDFAPGFVLPLRPKDAAGVIPKNVPEFLDVNLYVIALHALSGIRGGVAALGLIPPAEKRENRFATQSG